MWDRDGPRQQTQGCKRLTQKKIRPETVKLSFRHRACYVRGHKLLFINVG